VTALYDRIGEGYAAARRGDPRLAAIIERALGAAERVVNVGAGTGNYEPSGRQVTAVEPSAEMIRQRPPGAAPVVQASAEALPFADDSFDAAMATLTVHHWSDQRQGLAEMRRVATGPVVVLTFEPGHPGTWLGDYLPAIRALDATQAPPLALYREALGPIDVMPVPIPHDCADGFLYAYWRRPEAYLNPAVRAASSTFHVLPDLDAGLAKLAEDLASGAWHARYGDVLEQDAYDAGYRLVVASPK
jgi:SAM-dependent methyltransferase